MRVHPISAPPSRDSRRRRAARWKTGLAIACAIALCGPWLSGRSLAQPAPACPKASEDAIARQFDRWNAALASGNPDAVARLYAENAVLRVSPQSPPIIGRAAIRDYFARFLARHPQGTLTMRSISVSCNAASDTGTYTYRLTGKRKGTRMVLTGRYSTFYEHRNGDWLIVRHQG